MHAGNSAALSALLSQAQTAREAHKACLALGRRFPALSGWRPADYAAAWARLGKDDRRSLQAQLGLAFGAAVAGEERDGLYCLALLLVGPRLAYYAARVEDLGALTLRLWQALGRGVSLSGALRGAALNDLRTRTRRDAREAGAVAMAAREHRARGEGARGLSEALGLLDKIPAQLRAALALSLLGHSDAEIAAALGCSPLAAQLRRMYGFKKIKEAARAAGVKHRKAAPSKGERPLE